MPAKHSRQVYLAETCWQGTQCRHSLVLCFTCSGHGAACHGNAQTRGDMGCIDHSADPLLAALNELKDEHDAGLSELDIKLASFDIDEA